MKEMKEGQGSQNDEERELWLYYRICDAVCPDLHCNLEGTFSIQVVRFLLQKL